MNSIRTSNSENLQADIVVIGGGGAGLAAAITAAEAGVKNIILLEVRGVLGGNATFAGGIFAVETSLQKHLALDARKEDFFKKSMSYAHWRTNPRLVRALVDKSTDTIQWLEEKGVEFTQLVPHYPNQVPATYHACTTGKAGAIIVKTLTKNCEDLSIRVFCKTAAKKILTDERGNVAGVLAATKGKELRISSKCVIIATGGFAGNTKLLKKYLPTYNDDEIFFYGIRHKGDGVRLATEIGAAIEGMATLEMEGPVCPWGRHLSILIERPHVIWVNKNGERFTDETITFHFAEAANTLFRQPGKIAYSLLDEKVKQTILEEGPNPFEEFFYGSKSWATKIDKELQAQVDKGGAKISNSWDEIAKWIGIAPEVLKTTIDEYNSYCSKGRDDTFAKDQRFLLPLQTPPYYAIKGYLSLITTHGGPMINQHTEVLNQEGSPIRGLYAVGVETGGTEGDSYNVSCTGHSFGFSMASGRIAAENAARYVLRNK